MSKRILEQTVDFCVIGGGLSGMFAAIAAARHGVKTCLVHDRPVWGGNASSECRMWICGARGENNRETGLLEEMQLNNLHYNPTPTYAQWDMVLHSMIRDTPNLTYIMNCSINDGECENNRLISVSGYQSISETWHKINAKLFADCSGDSVLAPISGARWRMGRESCDEFGEDIEPKIADQRTMGMSCLLQGREHQTAQPYTPPTWARKFTSIEDFPGRDPYPDHSNYWWIELGGEDNAIYDVDTLREKLLPIVYGVWDFIKNHSPRKDEFVNWSLDWVGYLPAKRESRRYVCDYTLTQNDVRAGGKFIDIVAYGGWPMDDHHPAGFATRESPTIFHPAPSPFGIPYRSLYSKDVVNLFCAGRNIGTTHAALSSTRVMATCGCMGQAVGTAASIAIKYSLTPRQVYEQRLQELQQSLMEDDCYLPGKTRTIAALSRPDAAELVASSGDPENLRCGLDRPIGSVDNSWTGIPKKDWVSYNFAHPRAVKGVRLIFDSDLSQGIRNMPQKFTLQSKDRHPPESLVKDFIVEGKTATGEWIVLRQVTDNFQRLVRFSITGEYTSIRLTVQSTWGAEKAKIFAYEIY